MPLVPAAKTVNPSACPSVKTSRGLGWVMVNDFAFCPEKVEGFLRIPEHLKGQDLVAAATQVFFDGYTATVPDVEGELFQYLIKYRELK